MSATCFSKAGVNSTDMKATSIPCLAWNFLATYELRGSKSSWSTLSLAGLPPCPAARRASPRPPTARAPAPAVRRNDRRVIPKPMRHLLRCVGVCEGVWLARHGACREPLDQIPLEDQGEGERDHEGQHRLRRHEPPAGMDLP